MRDGVRLNGPTRGKVDAWLVFPQTWNQPQIGEDRYAEALVEFKRTDFSLKEGYVYQLCSYLYKAGGHALGKIILDHRHTVGEYTLRPILDGLRLAGWQVLTRRASRKRRVRWTIYSPRSKPISGG